MSLIINFFGGPGIGKSTQSAQLFAEMKKNHLNVELTYEFPKIVTWENNESAIKDQLYITANQHRNITRLYNQVDYIIVDSPIILGLIYKDYYDVEFAEYPSSFYDETFDNFIISLFKKYISLNIFLQRNDENFEDYGRLQDLEESKRIDEQIKQRLHDNDIPFIEFPVNDNTVTDIFNYIKDNNL